jgi:hypothetical protein
MRFPLVTAAQQLLLLASLVRAPAAAPVPAASPEQRTEPAAAASAKAGALADAGAASKPGNDRPSALQRLPSWVLPATGFSMFGLGALLASRPPIFGRRRGSSAAGTADAADTTTAARRGATAADTAATGRGAMAADSLGGSAGSPDAIHSGTATGRSAGSGGTAAYPALYYEYLKAKHTVWQQELRKMPKAEMKELAFAMQKCLKDRVRRKNFRKNQGQGKDKIKSVPCVPIHPSAHPLRPAIFVSPLPLPPLLPFLDVYHLQSATLSTQPPLPPVSPPRKSGR